tara:strand:- start:907 stop:1176 length:270 start_codon:yes stop_codon:yes gene_type:complete
MITWPFEEEIGKRMWQYEVQCCLKGLRGPLPKTPTLTNGRGVPFIKGNLKILLKLYGTITKDLLTKTCGVESREVVEKYLRVWEEMKDE